MVPAWSEHNGRGVAVVETDANCMDIADITHACSSYFMFILRWSFFLYSLWDLCGISCFIFMVLKLNTVMRSSETIEAKVPWASFCHFQGHANLGPTPTTGARGSHCSRMFQTSQCWMCWQHQHVSLIYI